MRNKTLSLASAVALAFAAASAQDTEDSALANAKAGDVIKVGNTAYMLVRVFPTPELNEQFQRNVNIMRHHAKVIRAAKAKTEAEKDEEKKKALETQLQQLEDGFANNNELMQKTYAFSVGRNYRQVFVKSAVCEPLSDSEMSVLKDADGKELDPMKIIQKGGKNYYRTREISGVKENEQLQRMLGFIVARKGEIDSLRKSLSETTDPQEQLSLTEKVAAAEKALKESDANIKKTYGITEGKSYLIEVEESRLYLVLTPEEVVKIEAEKSAQKAN